MSRICFLVNPRSGGGAGEGIIPPVHALIEKRKLDAYVVRIEEFDSAIAALSDPDTSGMAVVGGDGTFSSLLPYVIGGKKPLGIIPVGTGNDLARELGVFCSVNPENIAEVLSRLVACASRPMSVWRLSYGPDFSRTRFFCNYLSMGFDALVVAAFSRLRERSASPGVTRNRLLYLRAALPNLSYKLDNDVFLHYPEKEDLARLPKGSATLLFANIRSYMGIGISNSAGSAFDGLLECLTLRGPADYVSTILRRHFGWPHYSAPSQRVWSGVCERPVPVQLDGELMEDRLEGEFKIECAGFVKVYSGNRMA